MKGKCQPDGGTIRSWPTFQQVDQAPPRNAKDSPSSRSSTDDDPSASVVPPSRRFGPAEASMRYPLEGGVYAPLLEPKRYDIRELTEAPPPLMHRPTSRFRRVASRSGPRKIVDGVDDLRDGTSGLLSRHLSNLRETPSNDDREDFYKVDPLKYYPPAPVPPPTVDDRVTLQTLHVLLRKGRTAAAKILPSSSRASRYYSFVPRSNATVPNAAGPLAPSIPMNTRAPVKRSLRTAGRAPSDFVKATHAPFAALKKQSPKKMDVRPRSVATTSAMDDQLESNLLAQLVTPHDGLLAMQTAVKHLEPPNIVIAEDAKYYSPSTRCEDGSIVPQFNTVDRCPPGPLPVSHTKVPAVFASKDEERHAKLFGRPPRQQGKEVGEDDTADGSAEPHRPASSQHTNRISGVTFRASLKEATEGVVDRSLDDKDAVQYLPSAQASLDFAFASAARGDDTTLVDQLVRFYAGDIKRAQEAMEKRACRANECPVVLAPTASNLAAQQREPHGDRETTENHASRSVFSFLSATLTVSREFEKMNKECFGATTQATTDAATLSRDRQTVCNRLTSLDSSQLPEQYWVTVHRRFARAEERCQQYQTHQQQSSSVSVARQTSAYSGVDHVSDRPTTGRATAEVGDNVVVFPAVRPTGRAQVYLLAEALDYMLGVNPEWLPTIADPKAIYRILPNGDGTADFGTVTVPVGKEAGNTLLDETLTKHSNLAYEAYTEASREVIKILDAGITEVVRQVSCQCIERGALLDAMRQTLVDIAESEVRALVYTKKRAYAEARERLAIRSQLDKRTEELSAAHAEIAALKMRQQELTKHGEELADKAALFDSLMARVEARKRRFEIHTGEEHATLLMELERDMANSASEALDTVFEERIRITGSYDCRDQSQGDVLEAPSAEQARKRVSEEKTALSNLYSQSHHLLKSLQEATEAMNLASAPLYDDVILSTVSPQANLASSKWASYARSIGAFEREKVHRQRVFKLFCDWCAWYQKHGAGDAGKGRRFVAHSDAQPAESGNFLAASTTTEGDSVLVGNHDLLGDSAASCFSLHSDNQERLKRQFKKQWEEAAGEKVEMGGYQQGLQAIQFVTSADLAEMGVTDVTPAEVNALFAPDFDFKDYLHRSWDGARDGSNWSLRLPDVVEMVKDVEATLREMTARLHAMSESAVLKRGVQPPLQPPTHPEDRCVLCGRRDFAAEERKRRLELMRRIASDVQERMEELTGRCQRAEAEREDARSTARQLEIERGAALQREKTLAERLESILRNGLDSHRCSQPATRHPSLTSTTPNTSPVHRPQSIIKGRSNQRETREAKRATIADPKERGAMAVVAEPLSCSTLDTPLPPPLGDELLDPLHLSSCTSSTTSLETLAPHVDPPLLTIDAEMLSSEVPPRPTSGRANSSASSALSASPSATSTPPHSQSNKRHRSRDAS